MSYMFFSFGLAIGIIGTLLVQAVRSGTRISWYEWILGVLGLGLVIVAVWHLFASIAELESQAGFVGLAVLGLPGILLLLAAWRLQARSRAG